MKLAELFEAPLPIKKVTGQSVELAGAPGVKTIVDLDDAGRDIRIDPSTGVMTNEPSENDEKKMAQGIKSQIGTNIAIREKPWPAEPTMYYLPSDQELAGFNIRQSQFQLIDSGSFYVQKPNNLLSRPILKRWTGMQVTTNPDGTISLE